MTRELTKKEVEETLFTLGACSSARNHVTRAESVEAALLGANLAWLEWLVDVLMDAKALGTDELLSAMTAKVKSAHAKHAGACPADSASALAVLLDENADAAEKHDALSLALGAWQTAESGTNADFSASLVWYLGKSLLGTVPRSGYLSAIIESNAELDQDRKGTLSEKVQEEFVETSRKWFYEGFDVLIGSEKLRKYRQGQPAR